MLDGGLMLLPDFHAWLPLLALINTSVNMGEGGALNIRGKRANPLGNCDLVRHIR
jgi:hypothetical protein